MDLVAYSDSDASEDEKPAPPVSQPNGTASDSKFTLDKTNPRKIKVNLKEIKEDTSDGRNEDEPQPKRQRTGGGLGAFNAMLPAPKKDASTIDKPKSSSNGVPRKVFSLKTGAEPGFSRESDAELRQFFAEEEAESVNNTSQFIRDDGPETGLFNKAVAPPESQGVLQSQASPMMFKPLSVARNTRKKKKPPAPNASTTPAATKKPPPEVVSMTAAPKISLFSVGSAHESTAEPVPRQTTYEPLLHHAPQATDMTDLKMADISNEAPPIDQSAPENYSDAPQSLNSIASDLNLSASAKRQLLGRNHKNASTISSSVINFNTDAEYAANEELRASGAQVQHNPVRAIAPGKHSLKQLVTAATGQKEALEESFASGKRNKKEVGSRYGW